MATPTGSRRRSKLREPEPEIITEFDHVDMNTHKVADKYKLSGLTRGKAMMVDAPTVEECPIHVECKVLKPVELPPSLDDLMFLRLTILV